MANNEDTLAALFNGAFSNRGPADLDQFGKSIAQNNIWKMAAAPIMSAKFDSSTWNPLQKLGVGALQSFLGTALGEYGRQQDAVQLEKVAEVLPQLYANPSAVSAPEGVDPEAFGALKLNAIRRAADTDETIRNSMGQSGIAIGPDGKASVIGGYSQALRDIISAKTPPTNFDPNDPDSPIYKRNKDIEAKVADLRGELDKREETANFKYVNRLSNQLVKTLANPSAVADPMLSKMIVQLVEPRMAVNAGEAAALAGSSSIPAELKGILAKGLSGKSSFTPEVKKQLLDLASGAYEAHSKAYAQTYELFKNEAEHFGIDPARISSIGAPASFEKAIEGLSDKIQNLPENSEPKAVSTGKTYLVKDSETGEVLRVNEEQARAMGVIK